MQSPEGRSPRDRRHGGLIQTVRPTAIDHPQRSEQHPILHRRAGRVSRNSMPRRDRPFPSELTVQYPPFRYTASFSSKLSSESRMIYPEFWLSQVRCAHSTVCLCPTLLRQSTYLVLLLHCLLLRRLFADSTVSNGEGGRRKPREAPNGDSTAPSPPQLQASTVPVQVQHQHQHQRRHQRSSTTLDLGCRKLDLSAP